MKRLFLILFLLIGFFRLNAQNYTVIDTLAEFTKTTDFATLHDQIHVTNLDTFDFPMVWECYFDGKNGCPAEWRIFLNDRDSTYDPLSDGDSSSFILSATDTLMNKLIIGIDHNDVLGSCFIGFTIYPFNNVSDITTIGFQVTVVEGNGGWNTIVENDFDNNITVYPNPASGKIKVKSSDNIFNSVKLIDGDGNEIWIDKNCSINSEYLIPDRSGVYYLIIDNTSVKTIVVK